MPKLPKPPRMLKPRSLPTKHRAPSKSSAPATSIERPKNIVAHTYSPETRQLTVTFHHGARYMFEGVKPSIAREFADAESRGKFLNARLVGKFTSTRLED